MGGGKLPLQTTWALLRAPLSRWWSITCSVCGLHAICGPNKSEYKILQILVINHVIEAMRGEGIIQPSGLVRHVRHVRHAWQNNKVQNSDIAF